MARCGIRLLALGCCSLLGAGESALSLRALQADTNDPADTTNIISPSKATDVPCEIRPVLEKPVPATFTSSYPGSGAKLTWRLIRAITGIYTGDDHDHNGRVGAGLAVAVKTHFPSHTPPEIYKADYLSRIQQAILLIRNPLSAIPSYHNFVYEQTNGLMNHSTRAPVEVWIAWRNRFFEQEVEKWVNHTKWWIEHFRPDGHPEMLHLLAYEHLVSPEEGPATLERLGSFLGEIDPAIKESLIPVSQYHCIWELLVQGGRVPGEKERRKSHRSGGPSGEYPYTNVQLEYMIQRLIRLRDDYQRSFPELYNLLQEYLGVIVQRKKQVEGLVNDS